MRESREVAHPLDFCNVGQLTHVWKRYCAQAVLPIPPCVRVWLLIRDDEIQKVVKSGHDGEIQESVVDDSVFAIPVQACDQDGLLHRRALETDFVTLRACAFLRSLALHGCTEHGSQKALLSFYS